MRTRSRSGQSLMELLIGIAVAAIFVVGAATIIVPSLKVSTQAGNVQEQAQLAQELLSNVRAWAQGNWGGVLALNTTTAYKYYLNTATSPFTAVSVGGGTTTANYAVGIVGSYAGYFNGIDDYVSVASTSSLPTGSIARTMSGWIKTNGTINSRMNYFGYGGATGGTAFDLSSGINSDGKIYFVGYAADVTGNTVIANGSWHFVAVTYDGTTVKLYVDGALDSSAAESLGTASLSSYPFVIGRQSYGDSSDFHNANASIDDVRIYNTALPLASIQAMYAGSPPSSGLVGEWNFEGTSTDSSGNGNDGVWNGTPAGNVYTISNGTGESISTCAGGRSGSSYSRAITINSSQVSSTQSNFPVLFSGTYSYLATTGNGGNVANANGYDIYFTSDAAGTNILPFEQESYSSSTGAVNYWINVPSISSSASTTIYLQYGNSSITTSKANASAVWDGNYQAVYHFPNGTTLSTNDSTGNKNNATQVNSPTAVSGAIGGGMGASGAARYASIPITNINYSSGTIEWWEYNYGSYNDNQTYYLWGYANTSDNPDFYALRYANSEWYVGWYSSGDEQRLQFSDDAGTFPHNVWTDYVFTWKSGGSETLYVNGVPAGATGFTTSPSAVGSNNFTIGSIGSTGGAASANFDEFRISNVARSPDWITTEYNNQNSPNTFYAISSSTASSGGTTTTTQQVCTTYNRYFYLSDVYRDANGNVTSTASGNYYDPSTKLATVVVSAAGSTAAPLTYSLYITRTGNNALTQTTWIGGSGQTSAVTFVSSTYAAATSVTVNATGSLSLSMGPAAGGACYNPTPPPLFSEWTLNEGSGTVAYDTGGDGDNGTWYGTKSSSGTYYSTGKTGSYAGYFDASDNYISAPPLSIPGSITVSAWVYFPIYDSDMVIAEKEPWTSEWELFLANGDIYWSGGSYSPLIASGPSNNSWHFIAVTQSATFATIYLDGTKIASGTVPVIGNGTDPVNNVIDIGRYNSGWYFSGRIEDARIYPYALGDADISNLYSGGPQ